MTAIVVTIEKADTVTVSLDNARHILLRAGALTLRLDRSHWDSVISRMAGCAEQVWVCDHCDLPRSADGRKYADAPGLQFCDDTCHYAWQLKRANGMAS